MIKVGTSIEGLRTLKLQELDEQVAQTRALYVNMDPGQQAAYTQKLHEATSTTDPDYQPYLSVEAKVRGISIKQLTELVIRADAQWQQVAAQIEAKRIERKLQIQGAKTAEELRALPNILWDIV